jgi:hypothetical protein
MEWGLDRLFLPSQNSQVRLLLPTFSSVRTLDGDPEYEPLPEPHVVPSPEHKYAR